MFEWLRDVPLWVGFVVIPLWWLVRIWWGYKAEDKRIRDRERREWAEDYVKKKRDQGEL